MVLAVILAAPVASQRPGTVEVGVFGRGTLFDPSLEEASALGFGGRVAVFLGERWLLEADMSTTSVDGLASYPNVTYRPFHVRLNFEEPYSERGKMVVGLGFVTTSFGGDFGERDSGLAGLFGMRTELGRSLVGRVDFTMDFVPSPANGAGNNWIAGLHIGVGYRIGGSQ
jgi:hypothetical protein